MDARQGKQRSSNPAHCQSATVLLHCGYWQALTCPSFLWVLTLNLWALESLVNVRQHSLRGNTDYAGCKILAPMAQWGRGGGLEIHVKHGNALQWVLALLLCQADGYRPADKKSCMNFWTCIPILRSFLDLHSCTAFLYWFHCYEISWEFGPAFLYCEISY